MSQQKGKQGKKPAKAGEGKREDVLQAVVSTAPWWGNKVEIQIMMLMRPPNPRSLPTRSRTGFTRSRSTSRE